MSLFWYLLLLQFEKKSLASALFKLCRKKIKKSLFRLIFERGNRNHKSATVQRGLFFHATTVMEFQNNFISAMKNITYRISLNNVRVHQVNQQFQEWQNLNNVPFLCTKLFQKKGHYSRGDIIQGRTLFQEIRYEHILI